MQLQPDNNFSENLDRFLEEGTSRSRLSNIFQYEVAIFRFLWPSETSAEERHARAAVDIKRRFIGPVRVSLSSRLPAMEKWLKAGPAPIRESKPSMFLSVF